MNAYARTLLIGASALVSALAPIGGARADDESSAPTVAASVIEARVAIDGRLDEPFWTAIEPATDFVQREPDDGAAASERTEVRVAYGRRTIYIGILAFDSDPAAIVARDMQRDGDGSFGGFGGGSGAYRNDDSVAIVLDTFRDRRNGFYFETNPNGARADALIENEGNANFEWDGVWSAAARRTDEGWSAEIAIPFSTLRFDPEAYAWGFNVRRLIRRKNEEVVWSPVGRDANLLRLSLAGTLTGIDGIEPGLNLRVKPFGVGFSGRDFADPIASPGEQFDAGLELLRWGVTDGLTLDLTANTDFAQAEVDDQQINLTRFSLFFPEKREFFLENAGIFEFGPAQGRGGGQRAPLFRMFFSRRIGLDEDQDGDDIVVPITVGGRFTGRAGGWNLGLLNVQTSGVEASGVGSTNWAVARAKRNLGTRSTIGAIFTNKQVGADDWNRVFGIDGEFNPTRRLHFNGFLAHSRDRERGQDTVSGWAGGAGFAWRGSIWRATAGVQQVGETFDPELGFLLREGIRRYSWNIDFEPRPEIGMGIRNLTFNQRAEIVTRDDGTLETVDTTLRVFGFDLRSGDRVTLFGGYNFERLFEPFEIRDGIVIPPGDYSTTELGVFLRTDGSRPVSFFGFFTKGGFFGGDRFQGRSELTTRISSRLSAETSWNFNRVDLPEGSFSTNLVQQRVRVALSPDLFWNTFVQYNDAADVLSLNTRVNWIYRPGADVFLVYNQQWDTEGAGTRADNRALILKFTYLLSF